MLTVYRYYRIPASDGNRYKVYVETNEAGMHWIVEGNKQTLSHKNVLNFKESILN